MHFLKISSRLQLGILGPQEGPQLTPTPYLFRKRGESSESLTGISIWGMRKFLDLSHSQMQCRCHVVGRQGGISLGWEMDASGVIEIRWFWSTGYSGGYIPSGSESRKKTTIAVTPPAFVV